MIEPSEIRSAAEVVARFMQPTASIHWPLLSERLGAQVYVKHENHAPIGSFKLRGALNYMTALLRGAQPPAVVLASTRGNHGIAVAYAARAQGIDSVIVIPEGNSPDKNRMIRALGAQLIEHGADYQDARSFGEMLAVKEGYHLVKSFTPSWLSGVATCATEFFSQVPPIDVLYVPVGMGSGICAALYVKRLMSLNVEIVGVVAERAPAYALSFEARRVIETHSAETIADGLAARRPHPDALAQMLTGVSRFVTVTETEILEAMCIYLEDTHNLAEPASAAALAAALKETRPVDYRRVGLILTGGNATMAEIRACLGTAGSDLAP
jgi:threonine dehydratase